MSVRDKAGEMWPRDARVRACERLRTVVNVMAPAAPPGAPLARAFDELSMIM
jgi:hypothetical protein